MTAFEGTVALITGAGGPLGRAIALGFAASGAEVAANDLMPDNLEETVDQIRRGGGRAAAFEADVANKMAVQWMVEAVRDRFGAIDVLVNSAAVEPLASLLTLDEWDWDRTLAVNLKGAFLTIQSVARVMVEQGGGSIVTVAAPAARSPGQPHRAAYVASQLGLIGLTREAARELATYNIRVNAVCPSVFETERTAGLPPNEADQHSRARAIRRETPALPATLVPLVLFLSSPQAATLNGRTIDVDLGQGMT